MTAIYEEPEKPWNEVTQSILHDPANESVFGNCLQACVASVMKLPINAVPHFSQFLWWPMALELWLRGHDLTGKGERTSTIPDRLCIVGGQSPRGVAHVVVGYGGEIVWDPHPSREGLVSIRDATWFEPMGEAGKDCWFCHAEWGGRSPYADVVSAEQDHAEQPPNTDLASVTLGAKESVKG